MIIGHDGGLMVGTIPSWTCGCGFYSCCSTLILLVQSHLNLHSNESGRPYTSKKWLVVRQNESKPSCRGCQRSSKTYNEDQKVNATKWEKNFLIEIENSKVFFWLIEISATFSTGMKMKCWTRNSVWKVKRNHFSISAQLREKEVNKWIELNHFGFCVCECECV